MKFVYASETKKVLKKYPIPQRFGYAGIFSKVLAMTPDGSRYVTASNDGALRVWDLPSGACLRALEGHNGIVLAVAVTPDGKRCVSASYDYTLRVWDLDSGECLRTLEWHNAFVLAVAVTPDGKRCVSASMDGTLRVWNLDSGKCLCTLKGHSDRVRAVAVTPDGKHCVSASYDCTLRVWDLDSGECLRTLEGHNGIVLAVAVTPDEKHCVSASDDCTLRVWDLDSGECLHALIGHSDWVSAVTVTPDGKYCVSASDDCTLRVWDLDSGECLRTLEGHGAAARAVAVTPDGKRCVSTSADNTHRLWNLKTGECLSVRPLMNQTASFEFRIPLETIHSETRGDELNWLREFHEKYMAFCKDEPLFEYDWGLSSGEENLLRLYSALSEAAEDRKSHLENVWLFLDEADLSYHPEWQRQYMALLTGYLSAAYGKDICDETQLFLATHSPLMLGDFPSSCVTYLRQNEDGSRYVDEKANISTFGENIYELLNNSFYLRDGALGAMAQRKIQAVLEFIKTANKTIKTDNSQINSKKLLHEIQTHRANCVNLLAEGMIRSKLETELEKLEDAIINKDPIEAQIRQYEEKIALLRQKLEVKDA